MNLKDILSKIKFTSPKASGNKLSGVKPGLVFSALFAVIIILDLWLLQTAVVLVFKSRTSDVGAKTVQSSRVDFAGYNQAIGRIENAESYEPEVKTTVNPFKALAKENKPVGQ